jgi:spermidine synthase
MIPWKTIDRVQLPGSEGELSLHKRDDEFSIRIDGLELMNSLVHESEDALAKLACEKIADHPTPRVLIGGLGMGFTLASALRSAGNNAKIVVAELIPAVIKWNQKYIGDLAGHPLDAPCVKVYEGDVAKILKKERVAYDAILLDVDNGPEGMTQKNNNWLYSRKGLDASSAALRPKGVLGIWSVMPDIAFTKRLQQTGFNVEEIRVRSKGRHGSSRHTIWMATKG